MPLGLHKFHLKFPIGRVQCAFCAMACALIVVGITIFKGAIRNPTAARNCYKNYLEKSENLMIYLDGVMESKKQPRLGKSIFFHETSCSKNSLVQLNARQACAIESAARLNPNRDVFVLFASADRFATDSPSFAVISALQSYQNVFMRSLNLWTYAADTPVEDWLSAGELFLSKYLIAHVSDFLRFLSLYKFGGIYMDMDVVVQQNLDRHGLNYAGAESERDVSSGVMSMDHDGIGHEIAEICLNEFQRNFDGDAWSHNGPGVITRAMQRFCHTKYTAKMTRDRCRQFKVHPPSSFYAIPYDLWHYFFDPQRTNETIEMTKDSIGIHMWNKLSANSKLKVGTKAAYGIIAEKNCPRVYSSCGEYF